MEQMEIRKPELILLEVAANKLLAVNKAMVDYNKTLGELKLYIAAKTLKETEKSLRFYSLFDLVFYHYKDCVDKLNDYKKVNYDIDKEEIVKLMERLDNLLTDITDRHIELDKFIKVEMCRAAGYKVLSPSVVNWIWTVFIVAIIALIYYKA